MKRSSENPYQTQRAYDVIGAAQVEDKATRARETLFDARENIYHPEDMCIKTDIMPMEQNKQQIVAKADKDTLPDKQDSFRKGQLLTKWDALATWILRKLLPKSLRSAPPPDRQVYY